MKLTIGEDHAMIKILRLICFIAITVAACAKTTATMPRNYVLIVAGQSNAVGYASNPLAAGLTDYHYSRTRIWKNGAWEILNPADNTQSANQAINNHGIEPYIGYYFEKAFPNDNIYIIKYAVGGIPLAEDAVSNDWSPASTGQAYAVFVHDYLIPAFASSDLSSYKPLGLWWMQGESDALNELSANAYLSNLGDFFGHLTTDVPAVQKFRKFIGRVRDSNSWTYRSIVRQGQAAFCATQSNNAILIDTDSIDTEPDDIHYSAAGFAELGSALFFAMTGLNP